MHDGPYATNFLNKKKKKKKKKKPREIGNPAQLELVDIYW